LTRSTPEKTQLTSKKKPKQVNVTKTHPQPRKKEILPTKKESGERDSPQKKKNILKEAYIEKPRKEKKRNISSPSESVKTLHLLKGNQLPHQPGERGNESREIQTQDLLPRGAVIWKKKKSGTNANWRNGPPTRIKAPSTTRTIEGCKYHRGKYRNNREKRPTKGKLGLTTIS